MATTRRAAFCWVVLASAAPALAWAADTLPDRRAVRPPGATAPGASVPSGAGGSSLQQSLVELYTQIEALQAEVRQLRGQIEVQTYELERLKGRQQESLVDFDRRLRELERRGPATGSAPAAEPSTSITTPAIGGAAGSSAPARPAPTAKEQQEYDAAFGLLKQGMYEQAVKSFREFINHHPRSGLADNAQYWIAEAAYVQRNFKLALDEFNRVLTQYPQSPKTPDALLKLGYTYYELGAPDKARETLNQVVTRYPNTVFAKSAEQRLAKLTKEAR